jgi:hypothetical protein
MRTILTAQELSWVHQNAVVKLIGSLHQFEMKSAMPEYGRVPLNQALDAALSRQRALAQTGRTALSELIGLHNVELLVLRLFKVDWFDPKTVELVLLMFNAMVDKINTNAFRPLICLIMDAMLAFPEHSFVPHGSYCLKSCPIKRTSTAVLELCLTKIQQLYWSVTQKKLCRNRVIDFSALRPALSQVTTDIISSNDFSADTIRSSGRRKQYHNIS